MRSGIILFTLGFLTITGCDERVPNPDAEPPAEYPLRSGVLLANAPKSIPSSLDTPGRPPLLLVGLPPSDRPKDIQALAGESDAILDAAKLAEENVDGVVYRPMFESALRKLFGTPAEPKVEPITPEVADAAAGLGLGPSTLAEGGRVYRKYCVQCHGESGYGDGPNGRWLVPHPRDYGQGVFKFVSSDPSAEGLRPGIPRRADLRHTITHGMDGAGMPSFADLTEAEIESLISYVIHLSIRGEVEYYVIKDALDEINFPLPLPSEAEKAGRADEIELAMYIQLKIIAPRWLAAENNPVAPDEDPYQTEEEQLEAAATGYAIFTNTKVGTCTTCHVNYGRNPTLSFDIWGTVAQPRNLWTGTLRGGRSPEDIYTRLHAGISGVGMPSFREALTPTDEQRAKGEHPMWQVVHFLNALPDPRKRKMLREDYGIELE